MPSGIYDHSKRAIKHGLRHHALYLTWINILRRCYTPNNKAYCNYGGRGISVHDKWRNDFKAFYDWAIANGWESKLTIDRINNDGNYEPVNCRWVTRKIQNNNTRKNRIIEFNGMKKTMSEWSDITGIKVSTIFMRLSSYGWSIEKTLSTIKN